MATEKIVNYTETQTVELVKAYTAEPTETTIETFATKFGKTTKSIVAKLAKEKVYVSKAKEAGKRAMLKSEIVAEIATLTGDKTKDFESLEKATAPALQAVLKALTALATQVVEARVAAAKLEFLVDEDPTPANNM